MTLVAVVMPAIAAADSNSVCCPGGGGGGGGNCPVGGVSWYWVGTSGNTGDKITLQWYTTPEFSSSTFNFGSASTKYDFDLTNQIAVSYTEIDGEYVTYDTLTIDYLEPSTTYYYTIVASLSCYTSTSVSNSFNPGSNGCECTTTATSSLWSATGFTNTGVTSSGASGGGGNDLLVTPSADGSTSTVALDQESYSSGGGTWSFWTIAGLKLETPWSPFHFYVTGVTYQVTLTWNLAWAFSLNTSTLSGAPDSTDANISIQTNIMNLANGNFVQPYASEYTADNEATSGNDNPDQNSNQLLESVSVDVYVPTGSTGGFQFWTNVFDYTLASAELGAVCNAQMGTDASHGNAILSSISWQII